MHTVKNRGGEKSHPQPRGAVVAWLQFGPWRRAGRRAVHWLLECAVEELRLRGVVGSGVSGHD